MSSQWKSSWLLAGVSDQAKVRALHRWPGIETRDQQQHAQARTTVCSLA